MDGLLVMPAGVVEHLREGLVGVLARICGSPGEERPGSAGGGSCGGQREFLARLGRVGALLDVVGRSGEPPGRVMVDVAEHGWTLLGALHCELDMLEGLLREARAYPSGGWAHRRLREQIRVLRDFEESVEQLILATDPAPMQDRRGEPDGMDVGDAQMVERALRDLVPVGRLGSVQRHAWEPFSGSRCREDFAACCLHRLGR